jgi:hypothetical protein
MQCGNKAYKELHCRECGNNFPHDSYFSQRANKPVNSEPRGETAEKVLRDAIQRCLDRHHIDSTGITLNMMQTKIVLEAMRQYKNTPDLRSSAVNEPEKDVSNNEMAVCDIDFEGCKDTSYFPNCGDCVYLSKGKQTEC